MKNLRTVARIAMLLAALMALSAVASAVVGDPGRPRCMIEVWDDRGVLHCVPWP